LLIMDDLWLNAALRLFLLAMVFRFAGAAALASGWSVLVVPGWLLSAMAAWFAAAIAGIWVPLWMALAIGAGIGLMGMTGLLRPARIYHPLLDGALIAGFLFLSSAHVSPLPVAAVGLVYILLGAAGDRLAGLLPGRLTTAVPVLPVLLVVLWLWHDRPFDGGLNDQLLAVDKSFPLFLGVGIAHAGERIELGDGQVGWVMGPAVEPRGGVLVFHGAHPDGAHQHTAFPLQRALVKQGYLVMTLDHRGFGQSRVPTDYQTPEAWDPLPVARLAFARLEGKLADDVPRILVGHSMGNTEVLRALGSPVKADLAMLLGPSYQDGSDRDDYWYERFHADRGMGERRMPREAWRTLHDQYSNEIFVQALPDAHAPIAFVALGIEWPNALARQQVFWDEIPGEKYLLEVERGTHYLNTFSSRRLIFADVRIAHDVVRTLAEML